jgi:superfamily II DNA or RNA helicase
MMSATAPPDSIVALTGRPRRRLGHSMQVPAHDVARAVAVAQAFAELGVRKVLTFHNTVRDAEAFAAWARRLERFPPDLEVWSLCGSQGMSMSERNAVLHKFQRTASPSIVASAKALQEGVDLPDVDMVRGER